MEWSVCDGWGEMGWGRIGLRWNWIRVELDWVVCGQLGRGGVAWRGVVSCAVVLRDAV